MVVWNEMLVNETEVVTAYPFGPVALPMWGFLVKAHASLREGTGRDGNGAYCEGACRRRWRLCPEEQTVLQLARANVTLGRLDWEVRIRRAAAKPAAAAGATALCGASHEVREYFVRRSERAAMAACAAGLAAVNTAVEALAAKPIR